MDIRFVVQQNEDGTLSPEAATLCELVKEESWLRPTDAPRFSLRREVPDMPYVPDEYKEVPVGSIEFVESFLKKRYGVGPMRPLCVPSPLQTAYFVKRYCAIAKDEQEVLELASSWGASQLFIKSAALLKTDWAGVYQMDALQRHLTRFDSGPFFVSEVVDIRAEFRAFVLRNRLVDIRQYDGDMFCAPPSIIKDAIERMATSPDVPTAYTLDVAVLKDGSDVVLEVHPFVSCGLYGCERLELLKMYPTGFAWALDRAVLEAGEGRHAEKEAGG